MMERYILTANDVSWWIKDNGQLIGRDDVFPHHPVRYEFWIGNPPAPDNKDYDLFVAVSDFAVARGMMRSIAVYAVVQK